MTVASNSFAQRLVLQRHAAETGADAASVGAKLHDFGYRGCTSQEAAGIGGAAHLTVFRVRYYVEEDCQIEDLNLSRALTRSPP